MNNEFKPFVKIPRLSRECVITEKIDGTNALIMIDEENNFFIGSRTRWITPEDDNYGFARWATENKEELMGLGKGFHYGEWWGQGIQRKYGMDRKVFSLFNIYRWAEAGSELREYKSKDQKIPSKFQKYAPSCCLVVPILYEGDFNTNMINETLFNLKMNGSVASKGFKNPEGIVIYHKAANIYFKKTIEKDEEWKGKSK